MKSIEIPGNMRVYFIFSKGQKEILNKKFYQELSEIYFWLNTRRDEFQQDINILSAITEENKFSVLEIYSSGEKKLIENLKPGENYPGSKFNSTE